MKTLILAGGIGTRLFPLSRELFPKQFIPLFSDESLFQKTIRRALLHSPPEEIYIVTNRKHKFLVRDQVSELCPGCTTLIEPEGKNTLPAIYYGMTEIAGEHGPSAVAIYPSDHLVEAGESYLRAIDAARRLAERYLVAFGVRPTHPHTGYGYVKPARAEGEGFLVERFVEKPDYATAERYVAEGYLWNSGMFLFHSDIFFGECEALAPDLVSAFSHPIERAFAEVPNISVDYGIMEKTTKAAIVPLDLSWSDLGSFDALYQAMKGGPDGSAVRGEHIGLASEGNLIISDRLVATIGVSDMAIVDTKDALLICPRSESQNVGRIVKEMKAAGDERAEVHTTVYRPWGTYTLLENGNRYKIKRISVPPGKRLSLQMHHHRSEHWVVVKGTARVTKGGEEFLLRNGESIFVPAGITHRLENPGIIPLEIIEVQIGEYIGEDDIVRFDDDFDR
ncbi:MAG: mannose-1-phosphate guanylyltransferase/mannose-6-phosphate isomerase [Methanomicrobiaceae archaeon]|uniref:mannose-1-phosphate guanylyltransferase n=1 Tax=hydrocarbon metagenome TaxID=938273 RepID=A0A0W8FFS5_9ZZZZ|nr:mannose-1-phosphate guanylyltransferase/mannose-6-phosphate isomerase [Methanomicrobiaceae archaeon]MDD5418624.1 mannose-1-phosphate guanylyltransferase/mannose-6-phosphate isomerase [Methanomicrobiaceae archaeon]